MNLRGAEELPDTLEADPSRVYGQPYETADGTTVISVAKVRRRRARCLRGLKDGQAKWEPAMDGTRIALMGILVGLVSRRSPVWLWSVAHRGRICTATFRGGGNPRPPHDE